ncbi:EamA family transporter [Rhodobacteraceae bacterium KN286]|uniref:EamA family transporter n=2 Tax=Oceanomicrobium pacificus TaxID=2692916 RepID=A0A6B0TIL1_9RHOB|nr:EamA family transporter [Oceanomicrobium pacificus]
MSGSDWAILAILSILWGGSFFFNGVAVAALPPLTIVICRTGLAALILMAVLRLRGQSLPRDAMVWRAFLVMGLLNNVIPFGLIVWGQGQIASGLAAVLNATTPLFSLTFAALLGREALTPGRVCGLAFGILGVAVMLDIRVSGLGADHPLAQMAILGAAISYACAGLYGRRFAALGVTPMATATGQVTAATLLLVPLVLWVDRPWTLDLPGTGVILSLLGLASLCTALAYILYFRLLASAGPTNLLLVTLLVPVSAILLGIAFLGEALTPRQLAGMALIGCGLLVIDGRLPARLLQGLR